MSGFDDTDIDIVERLSECANIDEAEGATMEVVRMTREAANVIRELRKRVAELEIALSTCRCLK